MGKYLVAILIIIVIYYLYKKGIIKNLKFTIIKFAYLYNRGNNKLGVSYKKFNGIEKYPFLVKQNVTLTIKYNVTVEEGSLILKFINGNHIIFDEEFTSDFQGSMTFTPNSRKQFISLIGNYTRGGCKVEFIKEDLIHENIKA